LCKKAVTTDLFLIKKMEEIDEKNRSLRKRRVNRLPSLQTGSCASDEFARGIEREIHAQSMALSGSSRFAAKRNLVPVQQ
jgi:hypothetical protein